MAELSASASSEGYEHLLGNALGIKNEIDAIEVEYSIDVLEGPEFHRKKALLDRMLEATKVRRGKTLWL